MEKLFELVKIPPGQDDKNLRVCLGIRMKVGGRESVFPITRPCKRLLELEEELLAIEKDLTGSMEQAKMLFGDSAQVDFPEITPDMGPEEIWPLVFKIEDEEMFIRSFNALDEEKRRSVAEYVLTRCNIFSGKASVFSSRYNSETALME
ncbi:MAG: hypothetical protein JRH06_06830 [Deltaproteobacteria bacterium]|nr:hypothetical protein [Deltaproteobacteria bacterium]MBW2137255.1 hypothetical protein [Deltaproteobacteria bacterium]